MKITATTLALSLALSSLTLAGTSAKQAIQTLKVSEGAHVTQNILRITGRHGQDQPQEWEILARRGDQFAMFIVDRESVQSMSKVRVRSGRPIPNQALKYDSTDAFKITDKVARKANIGFDSLNYDLKPRTDTGAPVWIVSLHDFKGVIVGEVHIAGDSGSVLQANWDREKLNRAAQPGASTGGTRGILADRSRANQTTGTAEGVRSGIANIKGAFRKGQVSTPDRRRAPRTTKSKPR